MQGSQVVLVLEGGGSLGAYEAGVWKALAPRLRGSGLQLAALAGTSIGAVNAAWIAHHSAEADAGVAALERLWREQVATPSVPFLGGWPAGLQAGDEFNRLNGLMTGLLVGNDALHQAAPAHWNPWAALARVRWPLAERSRMARTLQETLGNRDRQHAEAATRPWLAVGAVDVMQGALRLFDSGADDIGVDHLLASSALPMLYAPVDIGGTLYWDGDVTRESMLPQTLARLRASGRLAADEVPWLITVSLRSPRPVRQPQSGLQLLWRMTEMLLQGKLDRDEAQRAGVPDALVIQRQALPGDAYSREFDFSPQRIDELIRQGEREAIDAWNARIAAVGRPAPPSNDQPSAAAPAAVAA